MPTMFKGTGLYSDFLFLSFFSFYVETQRAQLPEATCDQNASLALRGVSETPDTGMGEQHGYLVGGAT